MGHFYALISPWGGSFLRARFHTKAASELADDACELLDLAKEQASTVGRDVASVERGEHLARTQGREIQVS